MIHSGDGHLQAGATLFFSIDRVQHVDLMVDAYMKEIRLHTLAFRV